MAKDFIQKAIKKPGALRKSLGIKKGKKIPASKLKAAAKKKGKLGQRARFAMTLNKLRPAGRGICSETRTVLALAGGCCRACYWQRKR